MDIRFFVTGHGRSGTLWLARLLNADSSVNVHHEPLQRFDADRVAALHNGTLGAEEFIALREPKMKVIRERHPDIDYAEVNSYLRYCVPELRRGFDVPVAAIVRDGRYVVRSMMALGCYQRPGYPSIAALDGLTPFEACCWYWADTYRRLREGVATWRLEDLNDSYGAFCKLCQFLGVKVDRWTWDRYVGRPVNVRVGSTTPPTRTAKQRETFSRFAGDIQEKFRYPM